MRVFEELTLPLASNLVGVRAFRSRAHVTARLVAECVRLMTAEERERASRFFHAEDRERHALGRGLVRQTLSLLAPVAPEDWRFSLQARGRPVVCEPVDYCHLTFNLSHTSGFVMCAIAPHGEIGCDVENVERRTNFDRVAERVFSEREYEEYAALSAPARRERFFALWTLKEAYLKARGVGLTLRLRSFGFQLDGSGPDLLLDEGAGDQAAGWRFAGWPLTASHHAAVAYRP